MRTMVLLACLLLVLSSTALGTTYVVRPDGSGDFPTIQAAVDAVADGDIIELTAGTFTGDGNRDIDYHGKAITVRSQSGNPHTCTVDCGASDSQPHRGFLFQSGETSDATLAGITITNGRAPETPSGGAILVDQQSHPTVSSVIFVANQNSAVACWESSTPAFNDCAFIDNTGARGAGLSNVASHPALLRCSFNANKATMGAAVHGHAAAIDLIDCAFEGNVAEDWGGAVVLLHGCTGTLVGCELTGNTAQSGAAINVHYATAIVERCVFAENSAQMGGAVCMSKCALAEFESCTFWGNSGEEAAVLFCSEFEAHLENTVIAFNTGGAAMGQAGNVTLACSDIYGNPGGDWVGSVAGQLGIDGNISQDPLFCDATGGGFTLCADSPCAADNNPVCGQIGARPVGCGPCGTTAVEPTTWGAIKAAFD